MKSWIKSVWVKRLVPLLLLAAIYFGYKWKQSADLAADQAEADRLARVVAEVWVGSAEYRHDPKRFIVWRDSILRVRGVTRDNIQDYIQKHSDATDKYYEFSQLVATQADSITKVKDSLLKLDVKLTPKDSARADSIARLQKRLENAPAVPRQK